MRGAPAWLRRCWRFLRPQVERPGMIHTGGTAQSPCRPTCRVFFFCTLVMWSCGVRTLPAQASKWSKPLARDMRVTQILNPCHLLPHSFGVQSVLQSSQSGSVRPAGELRLELWCTATAFYGVEQTRVRSRHRHPVSQSVQFLTLLDVSLNCLLP